MWRRPADLAVFLFLALFAGGCASTGSFVWLKDLEVPAAATEAQVIRPGDLISVHVWNAEPMETRQRVRDDGRVSLFFMGDVAVAGLTPNQVAAAVAERLDGVVRSPQVNVVLEEPAANTIAVLGEVARPGTFPVPQTPTIIEALAAAGDLTEFAHRDRIFVLRRSPAPLRVRATYDDLRRGADAASDFRLRPGDVVVVE